MHIGINVLHGNVLLNTLYFKDTHFNKETYKQKHEFRYGTHATIQYCCQLSFEAEYFYQHEVLCP